MSPKFWRGTVYFKEYLCVLVRFDISKKSSASADQPSHMYLGVHEPLINIRLINNGGIIIFYLCFIFCFKNYIIINEQVCVNKYYFIDCFIYFIVYILPHNQYLILNKI